MAQESIPLTFTAGQHRTAHSSLATHTYKKFVTIMSDVGFRWIFGAVFVWFFFGVSLGFFGVFSKSFFKGVSTGNIFRGIPHDDLEMHLGPDLNLLTSV